VTGEMVVCVNNLVDSRLFCLGSCFETCHCGIPLT
jgi:hypothetical protein